MNREAWLTGVMRGLRPYFRSHGYVVPIGTRISVGWPSSGGVGKRSRSVAECWAPERSADGQPQIFISPREADEAYVGGLIAHEMIHAAGVPGVHGREFRVAMEALGFIGQPSMARPGRELAAIIAGITERLGKYPHAAIKL